MEEKPVMVELAYLSDGVWIRYRVPVRELWSTLKDFRRHKTEYRYRFFQGITYKGVYRD